MTLFRQESSSQLHFIYHSTQAAPAAARTLASNRSEQYCTSSVTAATRLLNLARLAAFDLNTATTKHDVQEPLYVISSFSNLTCCMQFHMFYLLLSY